MGYPVTGVCIYIHVYTSVCGNYNAVQFGTRSMQRRQSRARGRVGRRAAIRDVYSRAAHTSYKDAKFRSWGICEGTLYAYECAV